MQKRHTPQGRLGLTATRSPGLTAVTVAPMASTVPAISWPRIIGCLDADGAEAAILVVV